MRPQEEREGPYTKGEVCAMFEGALAAGLVIGLSYGILDPVKLFNIIENEIRRTFLKVEHEHFLALDSDTCFGCGIPMAPPEPVGGYVH